MKPTPEQVEAAKAWCKNQAAPDMMRCVWATDNPKRSSPTEPSLLVARILLAALEAAERICAKRTGALADYVNADEWTKELDTIAFEALTYDGSQEEDINDLD